MLLKLLQLAIAKIHAHRNALAPSNSGNTRDVLMVLCIGIGTGGGGGGGGGGGTGGMCPPMFYKLLYKLLTTLCVVSDCALPIKKSFLHLCYVHCTKYSLEMQ